MLRNTRAWSSTKAFLLSTSQINNQFPLPPLNEDNHINQSGKMSKTSSTKLSTNPKSFKKMLPWCPRFQKIAQIHYSRKTTRAWSVNHLNQKWMRCDIKTYSWYVCWHPLFPQGWSREITPGYGWVCWGGVPDHKLNCGDQSSIEKIGHHFGKLSVESQASGTMQQGLMIDILMKFEVSRNLTSWMSLDWWDWFLSSHPEVSWP